MPGPETSQSVDRAMELLHLLAVRGALRLVDIDRAMAGPRRALQRLLNSLENAGLVSRDPSTKMYDLGMGLAMLGALSEQRTELPRLAPAHLRCLADETGQTGMLLVRRYDDVVCAHIEVPAAGAALVLPVGRAIPLWAGAARAVLAHLGTGEVDRLVPAEARPRIDDDLALIRRQGWSTARGEVLTGAAAVTVPVFDAVGHVIACVGVMGYDQNGVTEEWIMPVRRVGAALSDALGSRAGRLVT